MELTQGSRLANRFKVIAALGSGTFGPTFLAVDAARGDRQIVLKALPSDLPAQTLHKLRQRVQNAKQLRAPFLARVYELVEEENFRALSYEYIKGTACDELASDAALLPTDVVKVLDQMTLTLAYLGAADLYGAFPKLSNIIRSSTGDYVLTDWVIPLTALDVQDRLIEIYRAPEIGARNEATELSDQFALGSLGYELCSQLISNDQGSQTTEFLTFINRCRAIEPDDRYSNFNEIRSELAWLMQRASTKEACSAKVFLALTAAYLTFGLIFLYQYSLTYR